MLESSKQQLGEARRVGVLLGGFDSALVAALLVRLGVQVETFSFCYENTEFNQPFADTLADFLKIQHHWIPITPDVIKHGLQNYSSHCSWPTIWPNYVIQTQHLCKIMAEQDIESCFSGDGCDTVFLGYPSTFRRGSVYQRIPKLPSWLAHSIITILNSLGLEHVSGHIYRVVISLLRASIYPSQDRPLRSFQLFDPNSYKHLTGEAYPSPLFEDSHFQKMHELFSSQSYARKIYFGKSLISPNRCKLVSSSDIAGFPIHSPYMHPAVKSFAQQLPDELMRPKDKAGHKEGKYILMKMAEDEKLLPNDVIYQPKLAAIKSPIDAWYDNELREFMQEQLIDLPFEPNFQYLESLMSDLVIEKIYKNHFSEDMVVSLAISMLATYASFFKKH
jgi:hypothetical protein